MLISGKQLSLCDSSLMRCAHFYYSQFAHVKFIMRYH